MSKYEKVQYRETLLVNLIKEVSANLKLVQPNRIKNYAPNNLSLNNLLQ